MSDVGWSGTGWLLEISSNYCSKLIPSLLVFICEVTVQFSTLILDISNGESIDNGYILLCDHQYLLRMNQRSRNNNPPAPYR